MESARGATTATLVEVPWGWAQKGEEGNALLSALLQLATHTPSSPSIVYGQLITEDKKQLQVDSVILCIVI